VTHADGTARPQVVRKADTPLFHALITAFERVTGVPIVVNTSFNVQEPIVQSAKDALRTFEATRLDALALGDYLLLRPGARRTLETTERAAARLQTLR
jgi:carbamoyltransferase